jgi:hypothetical protein
MALDTVQNYVTAARGLLQDKVAPYRYEDSDLLEGLNFAMLDAKKLRPDLFRGLTLQSFSTVDTTAVVIDEMYRVAFVYYIVGHAQLRDEEDDQDNRANQFRAKFSALLLSLA